MWHSSPVRWMAIDHGTKRIGIALCDPEEKLATPRTVWPNEKERTVRRLAELAREESVEAIVVGLPKHKDGRESATAPSARRFAAALRELLPAGTPVHFWGEELTSVEAGRILAERGARAAPRRHLDAIAAALLLEDLLSHRRLKNIPLDSPEI